MAAPGQQRLSQVQLLQSLLGPELRSLAQEASRRHPPLKDACERAAAKLAALPSDRPDPLQGTEELWRPLLLACDCKNGRLIAPAVGALTKLLSHGVVQQAAVGDVVGLLAKLRDTQDEQVQLKLLQCLMALCSSQRGEQRGGYELAPQQLAAVLGLAFGLHAEKRAVVQSTAAATIERLAHALFDRLSAPPASAASAELAAPAQRGAYLALKELCQVASGEGGQGGKAPTEASRFLALDLVHAIITGYSGVMVRLPAFVTLVREDLSLLVAEQLKSAAAGGDAAALARLHRVAAAVMQRFSQQLVQQQELFMSLMIQAVEHGPAWHKALVLSCWRDFADNQSFLKQLYARFDKGPRQSRIFQSFVVTVAEVIQRGYPVHMGAVSMSAERAAPLRLLALRGDEDPSQLVRPGEPVAWAVEAIVGVCKSLSRLVELEGRALTDGEVDNDAEEQKGALAASMLSAVWVQIRTTCALLLEKAADEEITEEALKCFKQVTHACGKAGLADARDAFIISMNKFSLPPRPPLTDKNAQVLKVLFHVANSLGGVLGGSWYILLRNFRDLDVILSQPGGDQGQADIATLRSMMTKVFEGTQYFDSESFQCVVKALVSLSAEVVAKPSSPQQGASRRGSPVPPGAGFALTRVADVCVTNVARLHLVWGVLRDHLVAAVRDSAEEPARRCALGAAQQVLLAYLAKSKQFRERPAQTGTPPATPPPAGPSGSPSVAATPSPGRPRAASVALDDRPAWMAEEPPTEWWALQPEALELLREMRAPEHSDVRVGTLDLLFNIIQRAGQELGPGSWRTVLAILSASSQCAAEVALGFKSVVLVCSDFMAILDRDALLSLIACVGHFAQQSALPDKTNSNLSSIQLTLSIADFCSSHPQRVATPHWAALFGHLRDAAADARPEVRQSALKTLFTALVTHGGGLPQDCWSGLFWDVLLRALDTVTRNATAAEQENGTQGAAPERGIIVHHSRNTAAKQWHETLCTALDGVTRVVRVFLPSVSECVTDFGEALRRVAVHLSAAALHRSEEVAAVGVKGLKFLLIDVAAAADGEQHAQVLWDVAWGTWEKLADAAAGEGASASVLTCMVECVAEVHSRVRKEVDSGEVVSLLPELAAQRTMRLLPLLEKLMRSPAASDGAASPTRLQSCVFDCLEGQLPFAADDAWQAALAQLAGYLPPQQSVEPCCADGPAGAAALKQLQQFGSARLCERALKVLRRTFTHPGCPPQVCAAAFPNLARALGPTLMTYHIPSGRYDLSRVGVEALGDLTRCALPLYADGPARRYVQSAWDALCSICSSFFTVLAQRASRSDSSGQSVPAKPKAGEEPLELLLLRMIRDDLVPHCVSRGEATPACGKLLGLVEWCARQQQRPALADAALATLFELCGAGTPGESSSRGGASGPAASAEVRVAVGRAAMPVAARRCREVLAQYLADDRASGRCPLPRARRDEVCGVLQRLASSAIDPALFDGMGDPPSLRHSCPAAYGPRGLAVRLFPELVDFVGCRDDSLRAPLTALFRMVAAEMGLAPHLPAPAAAVGGRPG